MPKKPAPSWDEGLEALIREVEASTRAKETLRLLPLSRLAEEIIKRASPRALAHRDLLKIVLRIQPYRTYPHRHLHFALQRMIAVGSVEPAGKERRADVGGVLHWVPLYKWRGK